jgi:hypothetical protein
MKDTIPRTIKDITPHWFESVVFADRSLPRIERLKKTNIGEDRGFLSLTYKIEFYYEDSSADDAIPSVIVKLQPNTQLFKDTDAEIHAFLREVSFYRHLAPDLPVKLPEIYFADSVPGAGALVMEDLDKLTGGDQIEGLAHSSALLTAREIAKVHARYWNNDTLTDLAWLPHLDHFYGDSFVGHWPTFKESQRDLLGPDAISMGDKVAKNFDWVEEQIANRPMSIVHGDLRADNLMFGNEGDQDHVVILDWQLVTRNLGALDIARMLGGSEPVSERQGHQLEIARAWHDELVRSGVKNYSREDAERDFRLALLHCLSIPVKIHKRTGATDAGRRKLLVETMTKRLYSAAQELNAAELLPA